MRVHRASGNDIPLAVLNNQSLNQVFVGGNVVINGEFTNGTTDWTSFNSTSSVSNGNLLNTGNGASLGVSIAAFSFSPSFVGGATYYYLTKVKVLNNVSTRLRIGTGNEQIFNSISTPIQNHFYMLSARGSSPSGTIPLLLGHDYVDATTANGKQMEVDFVYAYNLTALGIATLTKSQLDYLFQVWQFNQVNALVARQFIQEA
jgi:hypothetical protein